MVLAAVAVQPFVRVCVRLVIFIEFVETREGLWTNDVNDLLCNGLLQQVHTLGIALLLALVAA